MTKDELVGWHHGLNGHEFELAPGDGDQEVELGVGAEYEEARGDFGDDGRFCILPDSTVEESTCQCREHERCRFEPWVGKIPWRKAW